MSEHPLNIEVRLVNSNSNSSNNGKEELIMELKQNMPKVVYNCRAFVPENSSLREKVDRIVIDCDTQPHGTQLKTFDEHLDSANYHFYTAKKFGVMAEEIALENESGNSGENAIGSYQWELPAMEFEGLWESLLYGSDDCPKKEVLNFIKTSLEFACHDVEPTIIPQNRLILLNGPPGTGKTTLCKAMAQKSAIRMGIQYKRALLVEVNSHSLFSKWFSESGKLIQKLFTRIEELAERADWLIFVLIDEVESLTMGREAAFSGNDPTDSVRAVNAVLTQLDKIKRHQNVYILCTSNIERALDSAFMDRVGLVRHISFPEEPAIIAILQNCTEEMSRVGLLEIPPGWAEEEGQRKLQEISRHSAIGKFSGRALRKLPALAYSSASQSGAKKPIQLGIFLDCLAKVAEREKNTRKPMATFNGNGPAQISNSN